MLFEDIIFLILGVASFFMIILPVYKFIMQYVAKLKRDPLKEAKIRLELAKIEIEAAKINKEAEKMYDELYNETLEETLNSNKKER